MSNKTIASLIIGYRMQNTNMHKVVKQARNYSDSVVLVYCRDNEESVPLEVLKEVDLYCEFKQAASYVGRITYYINEISAVKIGLGLVEHIAEYVIKINADILFKDDIDRAKHFEYLGDNGFYGLTWNDIVSTFFWFGNIREITNMYGRMDPRNIDYYTNIVQDSNKGRDIETIQTRCLNSSGIKYKLIKAPETDEYKQWQDTFGLVHLDHPHYDYVNTFRLPK